MHLLMFLSYWYHLHMLTEQGYELLMVYLEQIRACKYGQG